VSLRPYTVEYGPYTYRIFTIIQIDDLRPYSYRIVYSVFTAQMRHCIRPVFDHIQSLRYCIHIVYGRIATVYDVRYCHIHRHFSSVREEVNFVPLLPWIEQYNLYFNIIFTIEIDSWINLNKKKYYLYFNIILTIAIGP
jgi:hypothetical protein